MTEDSELKKQWNAFARPDSTIMFYCEPERLEKAKAYKAKLLNAVESGVFDETDAVRAWDNFVSNEALQSFQETLQATRSRHPVRVFTTKDTVKPRMSHENIRKNFSKHQRASAAVILDHRAELLNWDHLKVAEQWKNILMREGRALMARENAHAQNNQTLLDPAAPYFD